MIIRTGEDSLKILPAEEKELEHKAKDRTRDRLGMSTKKIVVLLLKILFSSTLIFFLYRTVPLQEIWRIVVDIDWRYLLPAFVLLFTNTLLSALKWRQLLLADGVDIPLSVLTKTYLVGSFYNIFLPSSIGGDFYRIYDIAKRSEETMRSAASVFADRFSGFLAMVCFAVFSSLVVFFHIGNIMLLIVPACLFVLILLVLFSIYRETPFRIFMRLTRLEKLPPVVKAVDRLFLSFRRYGGNSSLLTRIMAISFIFQLSVIVFTYLLALSLHAAVPFFYFSAFVPQINLLEALPVSIYGLGVRDAGYVFFFGWAGLSEIQTRSLALLYLAMTLCYALIGGLIYFQRIFFLKKSPAPPEKQRTR
ncbi:MAG: lysylphosphatidylglycerol synthase transmembrane domain-containing protein [Desulforhopalus sp.]